VVVLLFGEVPVLAGVGVVAVVGVDVVVVVRAEVVVLVLSSLAICSERVFESVHELAVVGGEAVVVVLVLWEVPVLAGVGVVAVVGVDVVVLALGKAPASVSGEALVFRMYVAALRFAAISMVHHGFPRSTITAVIRVRSAQLER